MSETTTSATPLALSHKPGTPTWIDTASPDVEKSIGFYTGLFGWEAERITDPEAGGYVLLRVGGKDVAALGPPQAPDQHPAWNTYFATPDADAIAKKVEEAGGKVVAPPFDVLDSGRMAAFQDPVGAFFSVWQANTMPGFGIAGEPNTFGWTELNARGIPGVLDFYTKVFGWETKQGGGGDGAVPYTEFQFGGVSLAGAMDLNNFEGMENVPPFWLNYFLVGDIEATARQATELGGQLNKGPEPYPGGKFAIITDPVGAVFGLMEATV